MQNPSGRESPSLRDHFDTTVFNDIAASQEHRVREELAAEYEIFTERMKFLDHSIDDQLTAVKAAEGIQECSRISDDLQKSNEESGDLLVDLERLIEDIIFRLETIHHVRSDNFDGPNDENDEYDEMNATQVINEVFQNSENSRKVIQKNVLSCNVTLSKMKMEISELVSSNPRARRMSKNMGTLGMLRLLNDKNTTAGLAQNMRRPSSRLAEEETSSGEDFNPNGEVGSYVEFITKFLKEHDFAEEEAVPVIGKVQMLSKMIEHFKGELKAANQKSTEDQIKVNNLQSRLPKLEESRVRLSQQCDAYQDAVREKDITIAKLKIKIKTAESMSNINIETAPTSKSKRRKASEAASVAEDKQATFPRSVLKDIMQASDKEVEVKLKGLGASNEAIRVVLVRKNKQLRQLEGNIVQLNTEIRGYKKKLASLQDAIVRGTADLDAIKREQAECGSISPGSPTEPFPELLPSSSLDPSLGSSHLEESPSLSHEEPRDSISMTSSEEFNETTCIDNGTNTELECKEICTQTDDDGSSSRSTTPDLGQISFKLMKQDRRCSSIRPSIAMVADAGIRRASIQRASIDARRKSLGPQNIFGTASNKQMTPSDLATIQEINRGTEKKQADDIAVLQKCIASLREQSQKSMEKVRDFIAKEKTRNEATARRLINEHEKVLSNHKKEMNKVYYSICRFKETMAEILIGKDLAHVVLQISVKYEQSPLQLRILSSEMLSSIEFDMYQAFKEKDMKIRDLSGRKRLDDKDLDRRIKEREKTVFSILDHTNERLRKEKEIVSQREQWVNKKIKTELDFEKHQETEVQCIEKALVRFWKEHHVVPTGGQPPTTNTLAVPGATSGPQSSPRNSAVQLPPPSQTQIQDFGGYDNFVPKMFISVSAQRSNIEHLGMAHRAGLISNLAHKLITNIIVRWLELTERKIVYLFKAYIKFRHHTSLLTEVMTEKQSGSSMTEMNRAMILHRRIRDQLDLQYKRLHVQLGKLSTYCTNMLEEEENFFATLPDHRVTKNIVRPAMLNINHNAMIKKLFESVPGNENGPTSQPQFVGEEDSSTSQQIPAKIEDIPVLKQVANNRPGGNWNSEVNEEVTTKSLLIPRILQLDTARMIPVRLNKPATQPEPARRLYTTGLPPIPLYTTMKGESRFSYLPTICSVWSKTDRANQ